MKLSAYLWGVSVKNMMFPYGSSIRSLHDLVDEICIAYDPEFDDAEVFTSISDKVKLLEYKYDVSVWDIRNNMLQVARGACTGEWVLTWQLCSVLHEKDLSKIRESLEEANREGYEIVNRGIVHPHQNGTVQILLGGQQFFTRNVKWLVHKTPAYAQKRFNSDLYDGRYIMDGFDDACLIDIRYDEWLFHSPGKGKEYLQLLDTMLGKPDIDIYRDTIANYPYTYYYVWYDIRRKNAQGNREMSYLNRIYGRSTEFNIEDYYRKIRQPITQEELLTYPNSYDWCKDVSIKMDIEHPKYITSWLEQHSNG